MQLVNLSKVSNFVTHTLTQPRCENISNESIIRNSNFEAFPSPALPPNTLLPLFMLLTYASIIP